MDTASRDALLKHPSVKAAMKKAGDKGLHDPEVQKTMAKVAAEEFPHLANGIAESIQTMAMDPDAHEKAAAFASEAFDEVKDLYENGGQEVYALLEQGPKGVRVLAFFGGMASLCLSIAKCIPHFWNLGELLTFEPMIYLIAFYQVVFSSVGVLNEVDPARIQKYKAIDKFHDAVLEYCGFLRTMFGRGFFYVYQGSWWVTQCKFSDISRHPIAELVELGIGLYLCFIGVLYFGMHVGIMPTTTVEKSRAIAVEAGRRLSSWGEDNGVPFLAAAIPGGK